ncbi:MAG TPA: MXAN_5187 C-terminal domain-containing protein [Kofleriaceae bacterium]|nr:MXAN_5187 C-terminal domain-containing protein [Kofleriaceae bacterium]
MSRAVISMVVASVIVALTAIAFFVTSASYEERARKDATTQLRRAYHVIQRLNQLQSIDVLNKAERLASQVCATVDPQRESCTPSVKREAIFAFQQFMADDKEGAVRPDIIALVDKKGEIVAMHDVPVVDPKQWLASRDDSKPRPGGEERVRTIIPALDVVLTKRMIISDIWYHGDRMLKIGVAPVIDPSIKISREDPESKQVIGAIVMAYAQTAKSAQLDRSLLGTEIAYFDAKRVVASSFTRGQTSDEDTTKSKQLGDLLALGMLVDKQDGERVKVGGVPCLAAAVRLPRKSTRPLPGPPDFPPYPPVTAGAIVLAPIVPSQEAATVKLFAIVLGIGALAMAIMGMYLTHRRLVAQIDQVELGVADIINGNVDRTFRSVGFEVEGLSNALNVMLARLLGRPEPGEEVYDAEGNVVVPGRVEFDEHEGAGEGELRPAPTTAPELAALAQEYEPDYYKRVYTEYLAAKRDTGHPDEVSFENFIAKLKVNEGKLRSQYQCRAVRFRVVTKDGKVSLKPVPIFA